MAMCFISPDPEDYDLMVSSVVFTTEFVECLTFELIHDTMLEGNETFTVEITDFGRALMGPITTAIITIQDDDRELGDSTARVCSCETQCSLLFLQWPKFFPQALILLSVRMIVRISV